MGYSSFGKRPFEGAGKASHHHIINDPEVVKTLERIYRPPREESGSIEAMCVPMEPPRDNPIEHIITIDGGWTETVVDKEYPSKLIHFLQFGALYFTTEALAHLERLPFIAPEDMLKLKNIQRLKLVLPTKGVRFLDETTLKGTILKVIYEFFQNNKLSESHSLLDTLAWFVFRRYKGGARTQEDTQWYLSTNPHAPEQGFMMQESAMDPKTYTFQCPDTGGIIYLTDILRLHEVIDEEYGATGIISYLVNAIEHVIMIHIIRHLLYSQPTALNKVLFIKDGPCAYFGQTARMHALMFELNNWLFDRYNLVLAGLEKSGAFVEHANEIREKLEPGTVMMLNDQYIYGRILPGEECSNPYAYTSYYSHKVIFKTRKEQMYVVSMPVRILKKSPDASDIPNLHAILANIEKLQCDMYDSALFPIALVNKLVSLSAVPSQQILQRFAVSSIEK
jgi:hypothetical protein